MRLSDDRAIITKRNNMLPLGNNRSDFIVNTH